jgi:uncharacterized membrane protein YqiK
MKHILWGLSLVLAFAPAASQAEIYKWKDKNGVVRYSDIPPPSNVPHESLGKKAKVPAQGDTSSAPTAEAAPAPQQITPEEVTPDTDKQLKEEEAARQRAAAAEAELQQKQEQCTKARARMQSYEQGGRVYKINEKGEREFLDDRALAQAMEEAQADVNKYCQ